MFRVKGTVPKFAGWMATYGLTLNDVSVRPDEQVQQQVDRGNLVPNAAPDVGLPQAGDGFPMPPPGSVPNGNGASFHG